MPKRLPKFDSDIEKLLPFSKIRLIVLDLDGTIIDSSDPSFPIRISNLASSLKHPKHKVMMSIATGRTLSGAEPLLEKLPISKTIPIILYNGSLVLNSEYKILRLVTISNQSFRRIVKLSSNFDVKLIAYACSVDGENGHIIKESALGWSSLDKPKYEHNNMPVKWCSWDNFDINVKPSAIVIHTGGNDNVMSAVCDEIKKIRGVSFTLGSTYIEVVPKGSNKGVAIKFVAEYLQLSKTQILTMGDNDNDASMLSWAGIGVAVESASSLAKDSSDYIAKGVIEGAIEVLGIVRSANHLINNGRKYKASHFQSKKNKEIQSSNLNKRIQNYYSMFINKHRINDYCFNKFGIGVDNKKIDIIIHNSILPLYKYNGQDIFLKNDVAELLPSLKLEINDFSNNMLMNGPLGQDNIRVNPYTTIDLVREDEAKVPTFFSATRNLISAQLICYSKYPQPKQITYFSGSIVTTISEEYHHFAERQLERERLADITEISQFARSAYYMGSKRLLCGFIVEAISSVLPENGVVLDLMCGSGVVSGACNKIWETFSSDAQYFCRILAIVNGGDFIVEEAQILISKILPVAKKHFKELKKNIGKAIKKEEDLFCSNTDDSLLHKYKNFVHNFPTIANGAISNYWDPKTEISRRRNDSSIYPYCLFTSYFSNVYYGVRQCAEIDSLRYAIDQLDNEVEKNWALGALITSLSALGTIYGGHFAQPKIKKISDLTFKKLSNIINTRSSSITHEFTVRLLNLAQQNQYSLKKIKIVPGPWEKALSAVDNKVEKDRPVLVYLDAPYTREEYSRYYHVLETLALYNYPSCTGIGLTPKPGERFRSEFFKRDAKQIETSIVKIIINILQKKWSCAWSYSDSGTANICEVINSVCDKIDCDIKSYSVPSVHKSQGGARPKNVTEYLIVFSPKK